LESRISSALNAERAPNILITGDVPYLIDRQLDAIEQAVRPGLGGMPFNLSRHEGGDDEVFSTAQTMPMMANRRVVFVRRLEAANKAWLERFAEYLSRPNPSCVLVVAGSGFPKGPRKLPGEIKKAVDVHVEYKASRQSASQHAVDSAAALGHRLSSSAARMLVEWVGDDFGVIAREVEKASLYVEEGQELTTSVIQEACSMLGEAQVWDLTNGIARRDPDLALAALHRLLQSGEAPHRLMGLIAWQVRTIVRVGELVRRRMPDDAIRSETRARSELVRAVRANLEAGGPGAAVWLEGLALGASRLNRARAGADRELEALVLSMVA